jgi:hypothetical protein
MIAHDITYRGAQNGWIREIISIDFLYQRSQLVRHTIASEGLGEINHVV